jgi:hypothetical protein
MPSYFSVVQYIPDPIADERVNVGVLVYGDGKMCVRFLHNWTRVKSFGGEDVKFLRDFAKQASLVSEGQQSFLPGSAEKVWDEVLLTKLSEQWRNSIQITKPRASLDQPDQLLRQVAGWFLREPIQVARAARDKRTAAKLAADEVASALFQRFGDVGREAIKRNKLVQGALAPHEFDLVAEHDTLLFAANALSFEIADESGLKRDVDALAWSLSDIREKDHDVPLGIFVLPPRGSQKLYRHAERIFDGLGAQFVPEERLTPWADDMANLSAPFLANLSSTQTQLSASMMD